MDDDKRALIRACAARPDDDTPRLVFADWLDDHGDPDRAAYIRWECARARTVPDSPEWKALNEQWPPIDSKVKNEWWDEACKIIQANWERRWREHHRNTAFHGEVFPHQSMDRGFPAHFRLGCASSDNIRMFELCYPCRELDFTFNPIELHEAQIRALAACEGLGQVKSLTLYHNANNPEPANAAWVRALSATANLQQIENLSLRGWVNAQEVNALCDAIRAGAWPDIRTVSVQYTADGQQARIDEALADWHAHSASTQTRPDDIPPEAPPPAAPGADAAVPARSESPPHDVSGAQYVTTAGRIPALKA